jgi:hypothetical protein
MRIRRRDLVRYCLPGTSLAGLSATAPQVAVAAFSSPPRNRRLALIEAAHFGR